MGVSKGPDTETVGWVELAFEELAADLLYLRQLQEAGGGEEGLHVGLFDDNVGGVAKLNQHFHGVLVQLTNSYLRLTALGQFSGEHGAKVGRASCQYYPASVKMKW